MSDILKKITEDFSKYDEVDAILLAGSVSIDNTDDMSDYDIYIYQNKELSPDIRLEIAKKYADRYEINNNFWENGDEWILRDENRGVDIMYRGFDWLESELDRVVFDHNANVGYTTCIWHNFMTSIVLYDKSNGVKQLQEKYNVNFSDELVKNIIKKNYPILRDNISSYYVQIKKAFIRNDFISVNHRVAAFLSSYFDILFAVNKVLHPGEKKLEKFVQNNLSKVPENALLHLNNLLKIESMDSVLSNINLLVDGIDTLLPK